jgi:hypothetical protein
MTDLAIKAALDAAGEAARIESCKPGCCGEGTGCEIGPCYCSQVSARAAVVAFLRALPDFDNKQNLFHAGKLATVIAAAMEEALK